MIDEHRPWDPRSAPFATFALATDIGKALSQDPAYGTGKNARSLVRSPELTVVLTALQKGAELKPHHAPGPATAIVLEGEVEFRTLGDNPTSNRLGQHDCAVFSADVQHCVEATAETLLLIVIGEKTKPQG